MAQYLAVPTAGLNSDDTAVQALPQSQVDYLSHVWKEEDVWRSWRNMTRQKNAIANGTRLENASWRTWWKQRNKLKTISPEALNWLKDSDVTWLYGPLHSAVEPIPPPKVSTAQERLGLEYTIRQTPPLRDSPPTSTSRGPLKPILKHRSIVEMLTHHMPSSAINDDYIEFGDSGDPGDYFPSMPDTGPSPSRPAIPHTRSDTNLVATATSLQTRKTSPQLHPEEDARSRLHVRTSPPLRTPSGSRAPSDQEGTNSSQGNKRHISFNTFVEQCIAIEKPADARDSSSEEEDEASSSDASESDEDEPGVVEFRTRSGSVPLPPNPKRPGITRHNTHSGHHAHAGHQHHHVTIAPIAPTILKSSESFPGLGPAVVFVPPNGSAYVAGPTSHFQLDEDVPFSSVRVRHGPTDSPSSGHGASPALRHTNPAIAASFDGGDSDDAPDLAFGDQFRSSNGTSSPRGRREGPGAARYNGASAAATARRHNRSSSSSSQSPDPTATKSQPIVSQPVVIQHNSHLSTSPDKLSPPVRGRPMNGSYGGDSSRGTSTSTSDDRSESRGRSSLRGSSSSGLSDRSRSGSRHRVGSTSPIGSISPNPSRGNLSAAPAGNGTASSPSSIAAVAAVVAATRSTGSPATPPSPEPGAPTPPTLKSAMRQRSTDFVRPSLVINRDQIEAQTSSATSSGAASDASPGDRHDYWADAPGQAPFPASASSASNLRGPPTRPDASLGDDGIVGRAVSSARGMLRGILFNNPATAAVAQD